MRIKKKNPRYYSLKKIEKELDLINQKMLDAFQRYTSYKQALDSIEKTMNRLIYEKYEIRVVLRERKQAVQKVRTITKIQKLMKK